jgi:hypothetical protein
LRQKQVGQQAERLLSMFSKTSPIAAIPDKIWNAMPKALQKKTLKAKRKGEVYYHHTEKNLWFSTPPEQGAASPLLPFLMQMENDHTPGPYSIPADEDVITIVEKSGSLPVFYNARTGKSYPLKTSCCLIMPFIPHEITQLIILNSILDGKKAKDDSSVNAYIENRIERAFGKQ